MTLWVFSMVAIKECEDGYPFLSSVLHEGESYAWRSGRFILGKVTLATYWIGDLVVLRLVLDALEIRKISWFLREPNRVSSNGYDMSACFSVLVGVNILQFCYIRTLYQLVILLILWWVLEPRWMLRIVIQSEFLSQDQVRPYFAFCHWRHIWKPVSIMYITGYNETNCWSNADNVKQNSSYVSIVKFWDKLALTVDSKQRSAYS
jgi:hypothetical protein